MTPTPNEPANITVAQVAAKDVLLAALTVALDEAIYYYTMSVSDEAAASEAVARWRTVLALGKASA